MVQRLMRTIRRLMGMPDYHGYVEHLRACHPDRPVPSEREFYQQYLERRYGTGTTRCC